MFCIKCHHKTTQVVNSRPNKKSPNVWRRRQCPNCGYTFTTREEIALEDYLLIDGDNFSVPKLAISLVQFLDAHEAAETSYWLARTAGEQLIMASKFETSKQELQSVIRDVLGRYDPTARVKFELRYGLISPTASPRRGRPRLKR